MKKQLMSLLMHVLELAVCMAAAFAVLRVFSLDNEGTELVLSLVLAAFTKFGREFGLTPDLVNGDK